MWLGNEIWNLWKKPELNNKIWKVIKWKQITEFELHKLFLDSEIWENYLRYSEMTRKEINYNIWKKYKNRRHK